MPGLKKVYKLDYALYDRYRDADISEKYYIKDDLEDVLTELQKVQHEEQNRLQGWEISWVIRGKEKDYGSKLLMKGLGNSVDPHWREATPSEILKKSVTETLLGESEQYAKEYVSNLAENYKTENSYSITEVDLNKLLDSLNIRQEPYRSSYINMLENKNGFGRIMHKIQMVIQQRKFQELKQHANI